MNGDVSAQRHRRAQCVRGDLSFLSEVGHRDGIDVLHAGPAVNLKSRPYGGLANALVRKLVLPYGSRLGGSFVWSSFIAPPRFAAANGSAGVGVAFAPAVGVARLGVLPDELSPPQPTSARPTAPAPNAVAPAEKAPPFKTLRPIVAGVVLRHRYPLSSALLGRRSGGFANDVRSVRRDQGYG